MIKKSPSIRGSEKTKIQDKQHSNGIYDSTNDRPVLDNEEIQRIRDEIETELATKVKKRVRADFNAQERARLASEVRRDMEREYRTEIETLKSELSAKLLNRAHLLAEFTEEATRLLEEHGIGDSLSPQQVSTVIRQAVLHALHTRKTHLSQLVEFNRFYRGGMGRTKIREHLAEWFTQAGLRRIDKLEDMRYFTVEEDSSDNDSLHIVQPAYVDALTDQVIQPGRVRFVANNSSEKGRNKPRGSDSQERLASNQE